MFNQGLWPWLESLHFRVQLILPSLALLPLSDKEKSHRDEHCSGPSDPKPPSAVLQSSTASRLQLQVSTVVRVCFYQCVFFVSRTRCHKLKTSCCKDCLYAISFSYWKPLLTVWHTSFQSLLCIDIMVILMLKCLNTETFRNSYFATRNCAWFLFCFLKGEDRLESLCR